MFDYSERIEAFRDEKVRLSKEFREKLFGHRNANRSRLMKNLPNHIKGVTVYESDFKPQGSSAMGIIIQTRFAGEEYDIDDGVVLWKHQLVDKDGMELTAAQVKEKVRRSLEFDLFSRQPRICTNCVRVFYADKDEEKHHVDFPVYRRFYNSEGKKVRQLASEDDWVFSDPTQVNTWWENEVVTRNSAVSGRGTQLRRMTQLLKRFCRSRLEWDLPNGMKLTMLVAECQPGFENRMDLAFRDLLKSIKGRLLITKVITNLAHPDRPAITRTYKDQNVVDLETRIGEALDRLATLDQPGSDNADAARAVWDWIFKSDGFFAEFDAQRKQDEKQKALIEKAALIGAGARTSPYGVLGFVGVSNQVHRFYGEEDLDHR